MSSYYLDKTINCIKKNWTEKVSNFKFVSIVSDIIRIHPIKLKRLYRRSDDAVGSLNKIIFRCFIVLEMVLSLLNSRVHRKKIIEKTNVYADEWMSFAQVFNNLQFAALSQQINAKRIIKLF